MLSDGFFDREKALFVRRGHLPHWRQDGALYFVTFRLADSLPAVRLEQIRRERDEWQRRKINATDDATYELYLAQWRRTEKWLDQGAGSCLLRVPEARRVVETAIKYFDGERYELGDFVVAPNHAHALLRMASGIEISSVVGSWKGYSSHEIRRLVAPSQLSTFGKHLWQVEPFDHIVRNQASLDKFVSYIRSHKE